MNNIKERIKKLQGAQLKVESDGSVSDPGTSLPEGKEERIQYLKGLIERMGGGARFGVERPRVTDEDVARMLGGECVSEGLIIVEEEISLSYWHGTAQLSGIYNAPLSLLSQGKPVNINKLLFFDTETTGLAGGTGTMVFLLGMGRIERDILRMKQLFLTKFAGEAALLKEAIEWIRAGEHLVSFNGKCFDTPLLATRYRLSRMKVPFDAHDHIDLLFPTRCAFSKRWPDCSLQTAERRLLAFLRIDDLPGYLVPAVWFDFVRCGITNKLPDILKHNRNDIISLVALLTSLARLYNAPDHEEASILGIARAYMRDGETDEAYKRLLDRKAYLDTEGLLLLALFHRRRGVWNEAVEIWEALARDGSTGAIEHLAKYYEHQVKDYKRALTLTERLIASDNTNPLHLHRKGRLLCKLGRIRPDASRKGKQD